MAGDISGNSATVTVPLATITAQGPGHVRRDLATLTDAAGNTSSNSTATSVTVDTVAPAAPTITSIPENGGGGINASEASDGTPVVVGLTGTGAVAGDRLTINWGGQTVNYTLVAGDISGNSATVTVPLATITAQGQGTFDVTATLTDAAGNASSNSTATSVTVDTVAPAVAITTIEGGDDLINAAEAAGGVTVSGTAEIGATLTVNGVAVTVDASGGWTTSVATAGEGLLVVTAVATDAAGNSTTVTHDLTVDTLAPAVAITTIEGGDDLINAAEAAGGVTVSGTAEIGATLTVNGVAVTVDASGGWTTSVATAGEGLLVVTAVATDAAGNSTTVTHDLTVDTVAPAAPTITTIPENGGGGINASEASDGTPVVVGLTGTGAVAGDRLTINWGGQTVNYTLAAGDISASSATVTVLPTTITAQGQGTFNVTATLTDAAGNASSNSTATSVTVDTVAPAVAITTIEGGDDLINAAEAAGGVTVSGTAEIGATLTVNGVAVTVDASGAWTTSVATAGEGLLVVTAVATDAAGNSTTVTHDLTVDTLAPAVAITTIEGGDDLINAAEAAGGVTVSGTAEIGATLTVNGVAVTVDASGGWTTSVATAGEGLLVVTAVATDAAGNSTTVTHDLTVDTVAPAVAITTIEGGDDLINAAEAAGGVTVSGTAEIGATLTVNGVAVTVDASGGWTTSVATAGDGLLVVTAVATDAAGNSTTVTHDLTVDTVAPAVAITTIEGGDDLINAAEAAGGVTVSGTAEIGATLTVNGVAVTVDASGGWTTSVATAGEGLLVVTAVATDAAGNSTTVTHDLTVDTLAPAVAITTIEGGDDLINAAEAAGGVTVSGTAEIGATLTVNGVAVTVDASGGWTTSVATAGDGLLVVTAVATDAAGNSTTVTHDLTVDTLAPAVAITTIEGGDDLINAAEAAGGVTVSGTAEIGATLTVNGVAVTVDASGGWTTSVATAGDGLLVVTAVATDAAGNSTTVTHDLTVDTVAPAVAITTIEGGDDLINAAEAAGGVTVSGTAEIGATLTVNGVAVTVDASGGWTTSVATAGEGLLVVTAVATDAAGNSTTVTHDLTVDTVAPAAPTITTIPENGGGGINASEASDGTPVVVGLTGTGAVAGDRLTINWGGQTVNYTLVAGDISGNSATVTVPLATITAQGQGTFDVTATLTDAAGNASSNSTATSVTVDTVAPAAPTITSIPENGGGGINASEASDGTPVVVGLTGTGAVAGDRLTINWGGQTVNYTLVAGDISGNSATVTVPLATITAQGQGTFDVTATLTDAAGNASSNSTATSVTVDTVAPAVAITTIEGGDDLINAAEAAGGVTVSGTAEIGATLTVNGVAVTVDASGGWTTSVATAGDGLLVVTAVATDAAGNSTTVTHDLTVDTVAPAAPTITSIPENGGGGINASEASDGTPVVVGLTGTGAVAGDRLTINWGGQTVNYTLVAGDISGNSATVTVPLATITAQGQGTFNVTATLTDAAGNASSNSTATSVTVDSLGGGSGDVHMITFDGLHYDFQAVGDFVAAQSTDPGNAWQVQIRTGSWPGAVSITTELGALVGDDRVTFAIGRESLVYVDGVPDTVLRPGVTQTIAGGTLTEVSDDAYRLDLFGGESITVIDRGNYLDWTVALGPHDGPGSVRGLLGSNTGQTNDDFQLRDGTVLAQPLSEAEILSTFADAWTVAPAMSLLDETNVPAIGILAALALNVTDTLIGASGAATAHFTIGGLQVDDAGTVTFSDGTNHVTVNVSGAQINYTANLATLNDGQITSVLAINTDPAGNSFTPVNGNAVVLDQDTGEQAALALTVNGGAPIASTTAGAIPLTAAEVDSGLSLNSSYTGSGKPVNTLSVTAANTTPGETTTTGPQNIVVTDPPPLAGQDVAAATISNGASLEISSASVNAVTFAGPSGILQLDQSQSFRGTIAGFGGGDQIDLRDIVFGANTTLGYSANSSNNGGTLMVSDSAHTANISLLGQYMAASFAASSDGHGGTIIGDSPVLAQSNLTQPHA